MPGQHIAVLYGGFSSERSVSLSSGKACANGLERAGYQVSRVDVNHNLAQILSELKPDVCFNALHGPFGEDGTVQGMLEFMQIPYTHSGVLASALAMDKQQAKIVASSKGIPVAQSSVFNRHELKLTHPMAPPYVVKPVREGSSFGVIMVKEGQSHPPQIITSSDWNYGDQVMAERFVYGRELTCAVMGNTALGVTEIFPEGSSFYNFEAKYEKGGSKHQCPAKILPNIYQKIERLALKAHQAIGCRGVSRSDFRYDDRFSENGEVIWLEVNTQPGMTQTSLVPELAQYAGYGFEELVSWMVEDASCSR